MKRYFASITGLGTLAEHVPTQPVALSPEMHPMVFLMAITSYGEDYAFRTIFADHPNMRYISTNQVNVYFFISNLWKTDPSRCLKFLASIFDFMSMYEIDLNDGLSLSPSNLQLFINQDDVFKNYSGLETGEFSAPSDSYYYFRRCFNLICLEIPEIRSKLNELVYDKSYLESLMPPNQYEE